MFDFVSERETGSGAAQVKKKEQEPQRRSGVARESIGKRGKAGGSDKGSAKGGSSGGASQSATQSQWSAIVLDLFDRMDKDKNKKLSEDEINEALQSYGLKGDNASAVAVLHEFFRTVKDVSVDEAPQIYRDLVEWVRRFYPPLADALADFSETEVSLEDIKEQKSASDHDLDYETRASKRKIKRTKKEVFAGPSKRPSPEAVRQGPVGDCYFLAALVALVRRNPADLQKMIKVNTSGGKVVSYTVILPGNQPVTVDPPSEGEIARYSEAFDPSKRSSDGLWVVIMEKAFAALKSGNKKANIQKSIGEGDALAAGVEALTGKKSLTDLLANTPMQVTMQNLNAMFDSSGKPIRIVTAAIMKKNDYGLPEGHAYSIIWWKGGDLGIRNPWGYNSSSDRQNRPWPKPLRKGPNGEDPYESGVFVFSIKEFYDVFDHICYEGK
jgi:hypothetical protein